MKTTKNMFVVALAVGALIACNSSLRAQDAAAPTDPAAPAVKTAPAGGPPAGERGAGMRGGRPDIAKALDLTDDQKPKIEALMKSSMEKRKALREDTSLSMEDKKAKAKAIQEDMAAQMKAVLTPEQFAKFEKMSQGMRRNGPPGGGAAGAPAAPPATDKPAKN